MKKISKTELDRRVAKYFKDKYRSNYVLAATDLCKDISYVRMLFSGKRVPPRWLLSKMNIIKVVECETVFYKADEQ